ncbi:MAG: glycosyltransferase [Candidatus Dependentiae bacterium]|nr:glycosyltransferase [Candidatus Dependentiae bacterium]
MLHILFITAALIAPLILNGNSSSFNAADERGERSIVIVTTSYNNKIWYQKNLESIFKQNYHNYTVIYVDDCSPDGTGQLVEEYIQKNNQGHRTKLIKNSERMGALGNYYKAICMCNDTAIVVQLDGSDFLANDQVLSTINDVYANPDVWFAYSQFMMWPAQRHGWNHDYQERHSEYGIRECFPSHLHTFYAKLFKQIKLSDLMYKGELFQMAWDAALIHPMVEMAQAQHIAFIPEILYLYNDANPIGDDKVNRPLQRELEKFIKNKMPYAPLEKLF